MADGGLPRFCKGRERLNGSRAGLGCADRRSDGAVQTEVCEPQGQTWNLPSLLKIIDRRKLESFSCVELPWEMLALGICTKPKVAKLPLQKFQE